MSSLYEAFGLTLESNRPIPDLLAANRLLTGPVDVRIRFEAAPPQVPAAAGNGDHLVYSTPGGSEPEVLRVVRGAGDGSFRFRYGDGSEFVVEPSGRRVTVRRPRDLSVEDVTAYLLGPVLGFVLRLRGTVCLHASGVELAGGCVAILAPAGHGKSTTAATFARLGHPVLTDDVLALEDLGDRFRVQPAFPRLRLWPDAVDAVFGSPDALPRITPDHPTWDKRYLDLSAEGFSFGDRPAPLRVVYTGRRDDDAREPRFEAVEGGEAALVLIANSYASHLLDASLLAHDFKVLSRLALTVPVRRFHIAPGMGHLPALCEAIADEVAAGVVPSATDGAAGADTETPVAPDRRDR